MKRTLFDDDDNEGESGKDIRLTTNKEFAKKYEKKKKREELAQRLLSSSHTPTTHHPHMHRITYHGIG